MNGAIIQNLAEWIEGIADEETDTNTEEREPRDTLCESQREF